MTHNMHVKLFQVVSFKTANWFSLFIKYLRPRANKFVRNNWFNKFVASISTAEAFNVAITQVMLSSDFVSKDGRTKRALVGNYPSVHMISKVMSRQLGLDFVVSKFSEAMAFEVTFHPWRGKDITLNNMGRFVLCSNLFTVDTIKIMHISGPKLIQIDRIEPSNYFNVSKYQTGVFNYLSEHVLIDALQVPQITNIFTKLLSVRVLFRVRCVPLETTKPCSKHASCSIRVPR